MKTSFQIRKSSLLNLFAFIITPAIGAYIILIANIDASNEIKYTLAIAILMAVWWVTEVVPLAVTALLPVVLFPLFGVMNGKEVSSAYFNHVIFLFIGGFIVALAMQKWNLHKRIALKILMITGTSPATILLGFMLATAFLSMWISNTATTMMMIPILLSIVAQLEESLDKEEVKKYTIGLLLGIAYSASIGGIATLIGTPPNPMFTKVFNILFENAPEISFIKWFIFASPISIIIFVITWLLIFLMYKPKSDWSKHSTSINFNDHYKQLGKASFEEKAVFIVFICLALLWLTRSPLNIGSFKFGGWSSLFTHPEFFNDGTVAIFMSVILFIIPSKQNKGDRLIDWKTANKLPWNIVLLFGGGFALAGGFKESGLSIWLGEKLIMFEAWPPILIILTIALGMTFLTELTSNTATTQMLLPILAGLAVSLKIHPLLLMLPATISASMAFMLPVATPPNAIVFGSGKISIAQMAKTGLVLNLIGAVVITILTYYWGMYVFDIDLGYMPDWAVIN